MTHSSCLPRPTILKSSGDDFLRRRSYSSPVTSLNYHAILCEFLQVIQGINFAVPCGINTDDVELEIATCTVLPITYLVSTNYSILQVLLRSLNRIWKNYTLNTYLQSQVGPFKILKYTRSQRSVFFCCCLFVFLLQARLFLSKKFKNPACTWNQSFIQLYINLNIGCFNSAFLGWN